MTNDQINMLRTTLIGVFGECKVVPDDEDQSIYVEAHGGSVLILPDVVEVDTLSGSRDVPGWAIGLINGDGDFEDEHTTEVFWDMVATTAEMLAEQAVFSIREKFDIGRLMEEVPHG